MSVDVSVRDLRNYTKQVVERVAEGTTTYLTKNGARIAVITPLTAPTWSQHVDRILAVEPHDSGLAEILDAADDLAADADEHLPAT